MKITRGRETGTRSELRSEMFTGEVWADTVLARTDSVMINNVFFAPGARTHWHRHEIGQVLHVLAGRGRIYARDGSGSTIGLGDTVWIPPGEEHWHGAEPDGSLLHLAISLGTTEWLDAVSDDDYLRAGA
jgi:quercetin dioxygenase-like cupin family protein